MKIIHTVRTEKERERIKKRWAFAPGTDVWTVDFTCLHKTENFKLQLLTISDSRSRFLFKTELLLDTSTEFVIEHLENLFLKYGKPNIIKADNGPEFRLECKNQLKQLSIYLLNNPLYYGQFNGAHERIHRTLKTYISSFSGHKSLTRLVEEINRFEEEYNYQMKFDYLGEKTPADIFFNEKDFVPQEVELVTPYQKQNEFRLKFTTREGRPGRLSMPLIENDPSSL